jgi:hypothetical protein
MDSVSLHHTEFGLLDLTLQSKHAMQPTPDRINAELRGLGLLDSVVASAKSWGRELCALTGNTTLVAALDGFELKIHVMETLRKFLLFDDPHLVVSFHRGCNRSVGSVEQVCILYNRQHPGCAVADALVSLVLLGEANWPENATPSTLREFAMAAQIEQRARRLKLGLIELTLEDLEEINDIRKALELGIPQAAVDMLCSFCRRCYTCKGMEIEAVKRYTAPLFDEIPRRAVEAYALSPSTPSDLLFLPDFAVIA